MKRKCLYSIGRELTRIAHVFLVDSGRLETVILGTKLDRITGLQPLGIKPEEYHQHLRAHLKIRSTDCVFTIVSYVDVDDTVARCLQTDRTVLHVLEQAIVFGWHRRAAAQFERLKDIKHDECVTT